MEVEDGSELEAQQKHAALLEKVIRFGLNQSQYLIDVQVTLLSQIALIFLLINLVFRRVKGLKCPKYFSFHYQPPLYYISPAFQNKCTQSVSFSGLWI